MEKISLENLNLAKKTLLDFFKIINAWNINSYNLIQKEGFDKKIDAEITSSLTPIINQYCTPKLFESITGNCSDIPSYDINFLSIDKYEIVTKNKICFFITESNRTKSTYKYTMVYKDNIWRLDQKQVFRKFNNKWEKSYI